MSLVISIALIIAALMPERMVITPGREPTYRRAQEATDFSGRAALYLASSSGLRLARLPPFTGSMITIGIFRSCRISYSRPEQTTGLFQSA